MRKPFALLLVLIFLTASCMAVVELGFSSVDGAENRWVSKASMQVARGGLGVVAVNGKIYAIGGSIQSGLYPALSEGELVGTNEEYDPVTDTWVFREPMPTPRAHFAITVYEDKIYCIGGISGIHLGSWKGSVLLVPTYTLSGKNEVYDPATDTWETKTSMPTARMWIHGNLVGDKIYVMDGYDRWLAPNEVYDPVTDSWSSKTPMPVVGSNYASAVLDEKIYVVASNNYALSEEDSARLLIYDAETDVWGEGTPAPSIILSGPAVATTGVMASRRVYALGVQPALNPPPTNYVYDPKDDSWGVGARMRVNRVDFGVAVLNDRLYAIGGYTFDDFPNSGRMTVSAVNEQYTPFGYGTPDPYVPVDVVAPEIKVLSPVNQIYNVSGVSLVFTVDKPVEWMGYSLDGEENVTVLGNVTFTGLSNGLHNVTVYANDTAGNMGVSETVSFSVAVADVEPFPVVPVVASAVAATLTVAFVLFSFRKRVDKGAGV